MANLILAEGFQAGIIALIVLVALLFIGALVFIFFKTRPKKNGGEAVSEEEIANPPEEDNLFDEPSALPGDAEEPVIEAQPEETEKTREDSEIQPEEEQPAEEVKPEPEEQTFEEIKEETVEEINEQPAEEEILKAASEEVKSSALPADEDEPDSPDEDNDTEDDAPVRSVTRTDGHVRYIIIKYNKSFTAKLIQSADGVKNYYSELKNELLSYKGVKSRISWKYESFTAGRVTLAKIAVRGKNLSLFLALDPKKYADTKYIIDDKSDVAAYEKTPLLYRIKNDRRLNYSKELIETVMDGREKLEDFKPVNYVKDYPYEKIEPLVERALVKVLTEEDAQSGDVFKPRDAVTASEVNELLQDDIAVALIEESEEVSDRTKQGIVNIDTLSRYFADGETADLAEMKKRIPKFAKSTTYIKVLARGTLDKKLTVVADSFSIEAAKMILLTGGNAVKKKNS